MADPQQVQIIEFVMSLPLSTNPYEAIAEKIRYETHVAKPAKWGIIVRRIIGVQFLVLCGQAITVLWLRKRANKLHFFRYNKLGLIRVEVLNEIVLLMLLFSMVAFIDILTQEFVEYDLLRFSNKVVLHMCKFTFAAAVCWLFLWILGIEAAMNMTSLGARGRAGASIRLSPNLRFTLNSLFLAVIAVPGALLLWISIRFASNMRAFETTSGKVVATLLESAPIYRPESYDKLFLLQSLKPAESLFQDSNRLAHDIKVALLIYLVQHLVIATVYLPTSIFVLRSVRQQTLQQDILANSSIEISTPNHRNAMIQVRKRLISHAFLICLDEVLYLPPIVYLLFFTTDKTFATDSTWILIDEVVIHVPPAFIGNIILAFLIQNTLYGTQKSINPSMNRAERSAQCDSEKGTTNEVIESASY